MSIAVFLILILVVISAFLLVLRDNSTRIITSFKNTCLRCKGIAFRTLKLSLIFTFLALLIVRIFSTDEGWLSFQKGLGQFINNSGSYMEVLEYKCSDDESRKAKYNEDLKIYYEKLAEYRKRKDEIENKCINVVDRFKRLACISSEQPRELQANENTKPEPPYEFTPNYIWYMYDYRWFLGVTYYTKLTGMTVDPYGRSLSVYAGSVTKDDIYKNKGCTFVRKTKDYHGRILYEKGELVSDKMSGYEPIWKK